MSRDTPQPAEPDPTTHPPDDPATANSLTRIAVNLTRRSLAALNQITATTGDNRTDAVNGALRATAVLLHLAHPDGTLHVHAPDGTTHVVHLP